MLRDLLATLLSLAAAYGAFRIFVQHNDFDLFYHPDEWSKVAQIRGVELEPNFNHPLLMLKAARAYVEWNQTPNHTRELVQAGRTVSAIMAASVVFSLSMGVYVWFGFRGLILAAVITSLSQPLAVFAKYFKEDTTLVAGISLCIWMASVLMRTGRDGASTSFTRRSLIVARGLLAAGALGVAVGLTASGKYVGIAMLVPALSAVWFSVGLRWFWRVPATLLVILFASLVVMQINREGFENRADLMRGETVEQHIEDQVEVATGARGLMQLATPNTFAWAVTLRQLGWPLVLIAGAAVAMFLHRPRANAAGLAASILVLTWAITLACSTSPFGRYALPLTVSAYFIIALTGAWLAHRSSIGRSETSRSTVTPHLVFAAAILLIAASQVREIVDLNRQMMHDSRERVADAIEKLTPPGATIIAENYSSLQHSAAPSVRRRAVIQTMFAPDVGDDVLDDGNERFILLAEPSFERFLLPGSHPSPGAEAYFLRYRNFYARLMKHGTLIWSSDPTIPTFSYINPRMRLYRLPAGALPQG